MAGQNDASKQNKFRQTVHRSKWFPISYSVFLALSNEITLFLIAICKKKFFVISATSFYVIQIPAFFLRIPGDEAEPCSCS